MQHNEGGIFQSTRFWQGWALLATVAALFTFVANAEFPVDGHTPDYVAIVGEPGAEPLWVVNADLADGVVNVRAAAATAPGDGQAYQLWVVTSPNALNDAYAEDAAPRSLGVLPVDRRRATFALSDAMSAVLTHGKTLGISRGATDSVPTKYEHEVTIARL